MVRGTDLCLLITTVVIVIIDIALALCLRFVLPYHITHKGYYPADGRKVTFDEALQWCPCIARVFPEGTKDLITFNLVNEKLIRRRRQIEDSVDPDLKTYSFLVSLSIPAYSDDTSQKIFACNGLIQTSDSLLTTKICVKSEVEWFNLTVRSNSSYWSKLGNEHKVVDFSYINKNLVILKVDPPFSKQLIPNPPIDYSSGKDWIHAVSLGWDDKMYEKTINFRYKYKKFDVDEWTSRECNSETKDVCYEEEECKEMTSKPLLTSCHQLIGMKFAEDGARCDKFAGLGKPSVNLTRNEKGCFKVEKDTCHVAEMDVC